MANNRQDTQIDTCFSLCPMPRQFHRLYWCLLLLISILVLLNVSLYRQFIDPNQMSIVKRLANDPFDVINHTGRFDNSRRFIIHDFVHVSDSWSHLSANQSVCLATQTSVDNLFRLVDMSQSWQGLVSTAVFVPGHQYHVAQLYLRLLKRCFNSIKQNVSFHFVYPATNQPQSVPRLSKWNLTTCEQWNSSLQHLLAHLPKYKHQIYPQNHLRNVARKGCQTPYVFLIDVDIIPRVFLAPRLDNFLKNVRNCERCAFVVPTYEVNERHLPNNKSVLMRLIRRNQSQPFHKDVFIHNQFATNASAWERLPEGNKISVAYPVTNFELFFEPFYVARDDVPAHDERFVGFICD